MSLPDSIVGRVTRAHAATLVASGILTALVGGIGSLGMMVARDDANALALARTLGSELANHSGDSDEALDERVIHELSEQRWFERRIEVWRDRTTRVGGAPADGALAEWGSSHDGCLTASVRGEWSRVCVAHVHGSPAHVAVASSVRAVASDAAPFVVLAALVALASASLFALLGRGALVRALAPFSRFEASIAAHSGEPSARVATTWGAKEVDRLAQTFDQLLSRVAKAVERERRFVADAAHELRTPLTRLRGQIEMAATELADGKRPGERLDRAMRSCEELTRHTDSLLALARDAASVDQTVDACEVASRASGEDPRVSTDAAGEVFVHGDVDLLVLAVRNLVDNALKYSTGSVRVVLRRGGDSVELEVNDDGPGIPDEDLQRVREPFVRGKHQPSVRGAGLGLALVEHVARLHGGALELRRHEPTGLAAIVRLPAWRSETVKGDNEAR